MAADKVRAFLEEAGFLENYMEFDVSCATVELAAAAVGCEPGQIAKTLAFTTRKGPLVVVAMGLARIDNHKFRGRFGQRASFPKAEELPGLIGHPAGGVCPFAVNGNVRIYLDESLRQYEDVYLAAGSPNNVMRMSLPDLVRLTGGEWINVTTCF